VGNVGVFDGVLGRWGSDPLAAVKNFVMVGRDMLVVVHSGLRQAMRWRAGRADVDGGGAAGDGEWSVRVSDVCSAMPSIPFQRGPGLGMQALLLGRLRTWCEGGS
jgi:hypothetical protein